MLAASCLDSSTEQHHLQVHLCSPDLLGIRPAPNNGSHGSLNHLLKQPVHLPVHPAQLSHDSQCVANSSVPAEHPPCACGLHTQEMVRAHLDSSAVRWQAESNTSRLTVSISFQEAELNRHLMHPNDSMCPFVFIAAHDGFNHLDQFLTFYLQVLKRGSVASTILSALLGSSRPGPPFVSFITPTTSTATATTAWCPSGCLTPSSRWWDLPVAFPVDL